MKNKTTTIKQKPYEKGSEPTRGESRKGETGGGEGRPQGQAQRGRKRGTSAVARRRLTGQAKYERSPPKRAKPAPKHKARSAGEESNRSGRASEASHEPREERTKAEPAGRPEVSDELGERGTRRTPYNGKRAIY
jgi:hypothetical protein